MSNSFWNRWGLLNASEDEECSENTLLFSLEYLLITRNPEFLNTYKSFLSLIQVQPGVYNQRPYFSGNRDDYMSHDQLTSIINFYYFFASENYEGKEIWNQIKEQFPRYDNISHNKPSWTKILHPRDLIYYAYLNKNYLGYLFFPILAIIMMFSSFKKWKTSPALYYRIFYWFKTREWLPIRQMVGTDGKLLNWTRFQCCDRLGMRILKKVCTWIMEKRVGTWEDIFKIYFPNENHPIRIAIREYGLK